jgi:hypothetical protein
MAYNKYFLRHYWILGKFGKDRNNDLNSLRVLCVLCGERFL